MSIFQNTRVSDFVGRQGQPPASLRALRGVDPGTTPYGDDEQAFAMSELAGQLSDRQKIWEEQERGPYASHSRSPMLENIFNETINPSWSQFGSAMATAPIMAQNRGMKGRVDLAGAGPGSGTGIGRLRGQAGGYNSSGSFNSGAMMPVDLDTLAGDTTSPMTAPRDQNAAMRALQFFMRGR